MAVSSKSRNGPARIFFVVSILQLLCLPSEAVELRCYPHDTLIHIGGTIDITLSLKDAKEPVEIYPVYIPATASNKITNLGNLTLQGRSADLNVSLPINAIHGGHVTVFFNASSSSVNDDEAYVRVSIIHSDEVNLVCIVVGWIYFVAWSISFYPQCYENIRRKSVIGLNLDYVVLNVLGHVVYGLFNVGLYLIPSVQLQYFQLHPMGVIPVQLNDVVFSVHATALATFTALQCVFYERGVQVVSAFTWSFIGVASAFVFLSAIAAFMGSITFLTLLYYCSYVKLLVTLIKYVPQAYLNYQRQSTVGYSIGGVLLDLTGGLLSVLQMFLLAYNNDDWDSLFGDPTKFGLGFFSVMFDMLFIVQHYVLYRNNEPLPRPNNSINRSEYEPIEDEPIRSVMA